MHDTIFDALGTRPVINARGIYTDLGGSRLSPRVWVAMERANQTFVDMADLLDATGRRIAELVGAEAARVTPGASAAIVLGCAACMAGNDPERQDRLPGTAGMPDEVLIQARQRYRWDRVVPMSGARLVEVGDERGTSAAQFADALGPATAAILIPGHLDYAEGALPLRVVAAIAHERGLPVIVDAAYLNYPTTRFGDILRDGADLAIFSAKYFGGPNTGGFICGRADLIEAVAALDFTRHGTRKRLAFGRPFKLDRQLVAGVVEALHEWLETDHGARFEEYERHVQRIAAGLRDLPNVELTPMFLTMEEDLAPEPINCLVIAVDPTSHTTAAQIEERLRAANPSILVHQRDDTLIVDVECITDAEAAHLATRLREELTRTE